MPSSLQSSLTRQQKRAIARSRAQRRTENAWIASILVHGFVLAMIAIFLGAEWSHSPQTSFAWKVRLVQAKPVQVVENAPPPKPQQVRKAPIKAAPAPQRMEQVKRGSEQRLRELKARFAKQGSAQTPSVRPNMIQASSSQSTPIRQTAPPLPLPSRYKEARDTAALMAFLSNRSSSLLPQPHQTYADNTHSQSVSTMGQAIWKEGVRHTAHQEQSFSVNGLKMIAAVAEPQMLHKAPRRAPQPQEEDFGWLTTALNKKVQALKRYPYQAKLRRIEGKVVLRATVKKNGGLDALTIESPSGHELLDQDALETVQKAFPLTLKHNINRSYVVLLLPITYTLKTL